MKWNVTKSDGLVHVLKSYRTLAVARVISAIRINGSHDEDVYLLGAHRTPVPQQYPRGTEEKGVPTYMKCTRGVWNVDLCARFAARAWKIRENRGAVSRRSPPTVVTAAVAAFSEAHYKTISRAIKTSHEIMKK